MTDVVFISVGMTDTFLAVCVGWSETSAFTFWITLSGIDATVFITPVGVALTSTKLVSVSVAYATFTVRVGWAEATDATFITESLVFGTAVSAPEIVTLTETILIEVSVAYTSVTVAWVGAATAVTTNVTVAYPFSAVETVPVQAT